MSDPIPLAFLRETTSRRALLKKVGIVAFAGSGLTALAGCGGDQPASTSSADTNATPTVAKSDVPEGGGVILPDADYVVTQPTAGEYKAFSKICTHQQCPVGSVTGGQIVCPCHGSHFSIADGSVVSGPAQQPLPAKTVTPTGDNLVISG